MPVSTSALLERIGRRVAELRAVREWTQFDLADRVGCDLTSIERLEAGQRNITMRTLSSVAAVLRVDPIALFERPLSRAKRRPGRPRKKRE